MNDLKKTIRTNLLITFFSWDGNCIHTFISNSLFPGGFLIDFCRKLVEHTGGVENLEVIVCITSLYFKELFAFNIMILFLFSFFN